MASGSEIAQAPPNNRPRAKSTGPAQKPSEKSANRPPKKSVGPTRLRCHKPVLELQLRFPEPSLSTEEPGQLPYEYPELVLRKARFHRVDPVGADLYRFLRARRQVVVGKVMRALPVGFLQLDAGQVAYETAEGVVPAVLERLAHYSLAAGPEDQFAAPVAVDVCDRGSVADAAGSFPAGPDGPGTPHRQ